MAHVTFFPDGDPSIRQDFRSGSQNYSTWEGSVTSITKKILRFIYNTDYLHEELRDLGTPSPDGETISALDGYHYTTRLNNRANFSNTFNDDFVLNLQAGYSYYQKRKITYVNDLVNLEKTIHSNSGYA